MTVRLGSANDRAKLSPRTVRINAAWVITIDAGKPAVRTGRHERKADAISALITICIDPTGRTNTGIDDQPKGAAGDTNLFLTTVLVILTRIAEATIFHWGACAIAIAVLIVVADGDTNPIVAIVIAAA